MAAILLKNVPRDLHQRLVALAKRNHRSMNQQAILLLDRSLQSADPPKLPPPFRMKRPLRAGMLRKAIQSGRE